MSARAARPILSFTAAALLLACVAAQPCRGQQEEPRPEGATSEMLRGRLLGPKGYFGHLVFSADGKLAAAAPVPGSVILVFEVATRKQKLRLQMPGKNNGCSLAFSADGRTLVSQGQQDDCIRTWDLLTGKQVREVKKPGQTLLAFSPDGKQVASTDYRGRRDGVQLHDTRTGKHLATVPSTTTLATCAFSPDGKVLGLHSHTGQVLIWDLEKGRKVRTLREDPRGGGGAFAFLVFSPDGKYMAAGGHLDNKLRVWEVASGKELLRLATPRDPGFFVSAAFSPDGTLLAAGSTEGLVLHDLLNGKELSRMGTQYGQLVTFSPDGALLAAAGQTSEGEAAVALFDMPKRRHEPLPHHLDEKQLETFWDDLATDNSFRLQRVLAGMRAAPDAAVPFLGKKLQAVKDAEHKRVKKLLQNLDDDDASKREQAMADLQEAAATFEPLLMEVQRAQEPGEVRNRVRLVLGRLREAPVPPSLLTQLRAVTALEQIGTPAAREVLATLAKGASGARLTVEASQALERLEKARPQREK